MLKNDFFLFVTIRLNLFREILSFKRRGERPGLELHNAEGILRLQGNPFLAAFPLYCPVYQRVTHRRRALSVPYQL